MFIAPFQVRDLEAELEAEQRRHREASAAARKFERQLKELMVQSDEDRRMITDLTEQVAMLTQKIKVYKRQVEEAVSFTKGHNVTHCLPSATVLCECAALDNHCIFFQMLIWHISMFIGKYEVYWIHVFEGWTVHLQLSIFLDPNWHALARSRQFFH